MLLAQACLASRRCQVVICGDSLGHPAEMVTLTMLEAIMASNRGTMIGKSLASHWAVEYTESGEQVLSVPLLRPEAESKDATTGAWPVRPWVSPLLQTKPSVCLEHQKTGLQKEGGQIQCALTQERRTSPRHQRACSWFDGPGFHPGGHCTDGKTDAHRQYTFPSQVYAKCLAEESGEAAPEGCGPQWTQQGV